MDALRQETSSLELHEGKKYAASLNSILEARARIQPYVHVTPALTSSSIDTEAGRSLHFKCESLQKGGSFKFRGACNAVFSLDEDAAERGVVTHSSGNHAAAVALAAQIRGIPAHIVVPRNAPACKIANVERYGGKVVISESSMESREKTAKQVQDETGAVLILPFNDGRVISGQGTVAVEFLEQVPNLDAIFVPISGGGLTSGIALAAKALKPSIKIFAAEPMGADDAAQSKARGEIVTLSHVNTIADGLRAFLGDLTWPVVRDLVEDVIVVSELEILDAMKMCYERLKLVVEPSAVVGLAAVLSKRFQDDSQHSHCKNVGIIISGGNIDLDTLWASINHAIQKLDPHYRPDSRRLTVWNLNHSEDTDHLKICTSGAGEWVLLHRHVKSNEINATLPQPLLTQRVLSLFQSTLSAQKMEKKKPKGIVQQGRLRDWEPTLGL